MRWFILLLILSTLFLTGCMVYEIEKQPVLEQYILIRAGNITLEDEEADYLEPNTKTSPH